MESKNELYYILARNALEKLMGMGHLTCEQYARAESYIAEKYRPLLRYA